MSGIVLVILSAPSGAHHGVENIFPSPNIYGGDPDCENGQLCLADSRIHTVYVEPLGPKMTAATEFTLNVYENNTDLDVIYHDSSNVKYSGSWETDIIYVNRNSLPDNVWGRAVCDDSSPGNSKCDQFYVLYHADKIDADMPDDVRRQRSLACHETGHTLGLLHGGNADPSVSNTQYALRCMRTPLQSDPFLGAHTKDVINRNY